MKRRNVYIMMAGIVLTTVAVFAFIFTNQSRAIPTMPGLGAIGQEPRYTGTLYGDFNNPLEKPMDVATNGQFIYVSDPNNHQVQILDNLGATIFAFGGRGSGEGEFQFPYGLDFHQATATLYVADMYTGKISIFTDKGEFISYFEPGLEGEESLRSPGGLRIVDEKVYVTDIQNNAIYVFDLAGNLLLTFGNGGSEPGEFVAPNAIALDSEANIYVSDSGNHRVQVFTKEGEFLRVINGSEGGIGNSIFVNPRGLAVDARDTLYVVNNLSHTVHGFDLDGNQLFTLGGMGQGVNDFFLPNGLFIDQQNTIFITDTLNQRVVMYR
ncbi:DNA-binding beta-propeller fold protein YncE [Evansella vedderi]|uniref:DNA-binding beta-propeller fold protein YncE n=1 Tax=Evansella vedderi TaxID=38282 RepID=A0ABT9ZZJ8_9BACI|nr:6-bladed beta-propeller [Evansella vedderi]MDQ0256668.1 DNA-binding beta-propeller fold protein YncE [Evansella vedderi]